MKPAKPFSRIARWSVGIVLASVFFFVIADQHTDAHNPITSKYDYNHDIFPLFVDHCARCHSKSGPAPMSLLTYQEAVPWAESIRDELTAGRMPPWPVDPTSPPVKGGYSISAQDLDKIVVWVSGGTPQGIFGTKPPVATFAPHSALGPPDLIIPIPAEHKMAADAAAEIVDTTLPTNLSEVKWLKAADLMPGTAHVVRDAIISVENGPVLALWQPGDDAIAAPDQTAFRLAPGAKIHLQIHYEKRFDQEAGAVSDRSTIGLYFTDPPKSGRGLQSFAINAPDSGYDRDESLVFTGTVPSAASIVALRPMLDRAYESLNVVAITPSGARVPLLRLTGPRPQWLRRYWLQQPVELSSGSRIEVSVMPLSDDSDEPKATKRFSLQVVLDYVPL